MNIEKDLLDIFKKYKEETNESINELCESILELRRNISELKEFNQFLTEELIKKALKIPNF